MAQYRKRRAAAGPSKNEEKVRRGQEGARRAPSLSERFPGVSRMTLELTVTGPRGDAESRTLAFGPGDPVELTTDCPGPCGRGSFDLSEMVSAAVAERREAGQASAVCPVALYADLPDTCGYKLDCRLSVQY